MNLQLESITKNDRNWVRELMIDHWGGETVVSRGQVHRPEELPGVIAWRAQERVGLVTYRVADHEWEIVTLDSLVAGLGVGTSLIHTVRESAQKAGCTRLWLITTNDNLHALGFYQKRGFHIAAIHVNALAQSRKLKPGIPLLGMEAIPLRDEIELEIVFQT